MTEDSNLAKRRSPAFHKLRVATISIRSIVRLRNNVPKACDDLEELYESVENSPTIRRIITSRSLTSQAISNHKNTEQLFECIRRGGKEDVMQIEQLINSSTTSYLRDSTDPDSIVNKPNAQGVRPIHEAVRNGHEEIIDLLFSFKADPFLSSQVSEKDSETALVTAARWNYFNIVKQLLSLGTWPVRELKTAYKASSSKLIKKTLKDYNPKAFTWWKCFG